MSKRIKGVYTSTYDAQPTIQLRIDSREGHDVPLNGNLGTLSKL
jgi:hypothetical protein